jgi:hypothetical protein
MISRTASARGAIRFTFGGFGALESLAMDSTQASGGNPGVAAGRGGGSVAQEVLNCGQVSGGFQDARSEVVTELMGREGFLQPGLPGQGGQGAADPFGGQGADAGTGPFVVACEEGEVISAFPAGSHVAGLQVSLEGAGSRLV